MAKQARDQAARAMGSSEGRETVDIDFGAPSEFDSEEMVKSAAFEAWRLGGKVKMFTTSRQIIKLKEAERGLKALWRELRDRIPMPDFVHFEATSKDTSVEASQRARGYARDLDLVMSRAKSYTMTTPAIDYFASY